MLGIAVGAFVVVRLASFVDRGPVGYRDPDVLLEAGLWVLTAIVVVSIVDFAGRFAPGLERFSPAARRRAAIAGLGAAVVAAVAVGLALGEGVWGFPLADLWWWLNTVYLMQLSVAFGLAAIVGTPGCEQGVWQELLGRRGSAGHTVLSCVIGLHSLDEWEARRRRSSA